MLRTEPISKKFKDFQAVKDLYTSVFPLSGQAPMWFLLHRARKEHIKFNAYYDKDSFLGFSYMVIYNQICYIAYLAVDTQCHSKGHGTQILNHIKSDYPNNRIVLGIEVEDENAENNEQRKKRRQFYARNGFSSSGSLLESRGDTFDLLVYNGQCTNKEFFVLYKKFLGSIVSAFVKPKVIA